MYHVIYNKPIAEVDLKIRNSIAEFRNILSDMPAPFLMEMYSLMETIDEEGNPQISFNQFNDLVKLINCYLIRRSICSLDTSDITRLFPTLLKDVIRDCNGDYDKVVEYTKKNLVNKQRGKSAMMPDDAYMRTYLEYANVYNLRLTLRF